MLERDVGLFSLIQQVVANVPWALGEGRIPVALFGGQCCYWTPAGYQGRDTVWEYYFEPLVATHPADSIGSELRELAEAYVFQGDKLGIVHKNAFFTSQFGNHPDLAGKALNIPHRWDDPEEPLRLCTSKIFARYVRPRAYLLEKVDQFFEERLSGTYNVGVHVRGTDAVSFRERRAHRIGSLSFRQYVKFIEQMIRKQPDSRIFVATDTEKVVRYLAKRFGDRVVAYEALRHDGGSVAGSGPAGGMLPAYIAGDRDDAARNGEEAVIDYLLLSR
jgi:hypothetical protein